MKVAITSLDRWRSRLSLNPSQQLAQRTVPCTESPRFAGDDISVFKILRYASSAEYPSLSGKIPWFGLEVLFVCLNMDSDFNVLDPCLIRQDDGSFDLPLRNRPVLFKKPILFLFRNEFVVVLLVK